MALKQLWCETAVSRSLRNVRNREGTNSQWSCSNNTGGSRDAHGTHETQGSHSRTSQTTRPAPRPRSRPNPPFYCTMDLDKNAMKHTCENCVHL